MINAAHMPPDSHQSKPTIEKTARPTPIQLAEGRSLALSPLRRPGLTSHSPTCHSEGSFCTKFSASFL